MADETYDACQALALAASSMLEAAWSPMQVRHGELDWNLTSAYVLDVCDATAQFAQEPARMGAEIVRTWAERAAELARREVALRDKVINKPRYGPIIVLASQIAVTLEHLAKLIATLEAP